MKAPDLAAVLANMTEHQSRLRALLETFDRETLATRPPGGDWSATENIRHAFYAEQHHLGLYIPGGLGLSPLGLPQGAHAHVRGDDPRTDLPAVFDEWTRVHAEVCEKLDLAIPWMAIQVPRLMRHQQQHARAAARALSQITGQPVRLPRAT